MTPDIESAAGSDIQADVAVVGGGPTVASTDREPDRWAVLAVLSVAQLMVVLDAMIVTIAIPSAHQALGFSTDSLQWIVTAYALAFGSLLLLGGKLGDLFGRKWTLIAGLVGFATASAIGGLGPLARPIDPSNRPSDMTAAPSNARN